MAFLPNLEKRLQDLQFDAENGYGKLYSSTYHAILGYFQQHIDVVNVGEDCAKLGAALCYTWMPTIKVKPDSFQNFPTFRRALEKARQGQFDAASLADLISFVGGSVVATSKFMHFLKPDTYAIWDSRVARARYGFDNYAQYARPDRLMQYWKDTNEPGIKWDEKFKEEFPNVTKLRRRELALFHLDKAKQCPHKRK